MEHEERLKAALADRYQIERGIGSGGMATVYLARDLKHDRKVAVKVLKPELAAVMGTERFLAEIRTTANLTHPHILPLHDSGEADGFLFYVMPYVEGDSLRQRLDRDGQLSVEEAVRVAGHVAEALDHAHRQGVIHRDVKPSNILFEDDQPVVTDFGIALAISAAGEGRLTETGLSLGTPYYMSPEQAAGDQTPTAASDVYSLGCVLYEMLTGEPPHTGVSAQAILGKILLAEVTRPTKLRRTIPANVESAVLRALERLPADRFESAAELAVALKDKTFRHGMSAGAGAMAGPWRGIAIGFGVTTILAVVAFVAVVVTPEPLPPTFRQQIHPLGSGIGPNWANFFAFAPDGSSMVYADTVGTGTGWQLWAKDRGSAQGRPLSGTTSAREIFYSPDGQWIAYVVGANLMKRPLQGAGTQTLLEGIGAGQVAISWMDDGTILCEGPRGILVRVSNDMNVPPDTVSSFAGNPTGNPIWARGLPGGEAALVVTCVGTNCSQGSVLNVVDFQADSAWVVLEDVLRAWYVPTGHVVWVRLDGAVFATPFNLDRLEFSGAHTSLFEGVRTGSTVADMVMAEDGTVVYVEGLAGGALPSELVWVDRQGRVMPVDLEWTFDPGANNRGLSLSPDGSSLVVTRFEDGNYDVWTKELPRGPATRLTFDLAQDLRPRWTPDGQAVTFLSDRAEPGNPDVYSVRASGTGDPVALWDHELQLWEAVYSPDMTWLLGRTGGTTTIAGGRDVWAIQTGTDTVAIPLIVTNYDEKAISFSPDGDFLLYESDETGQNEVYVRPFPNVNDDKTSVSIGGGVMPVWSRGGGEIFYIDDENMMSVATVETSPTFRVTSRTTLFKLPEGILFQQGEQYPLYDVVPEDDRFVMIRTKDVVGGPEPAMILILNFFTELRERVGEGR